MNILKRRHTITIQAFTAAKDAYNEPVETWADWKTGVMASIEPLQASEDLEAVQVNSKQRYRFRFRYFAGLLPKMRIVFDGVQYDIISAANYRMLNKEWYVLAEESSLDQS